MADILETENNRLARQWELAQHSQTLRAALMRVPLTATFELTPLCNLSCKMCYIRMSRQERDSLGRELTTQEWLRLARETLDLGTLNLMLTGGEAMLRPDFEELYTELAHMGFFVSLNTNGTLMTPRMTELLKKYPPSSMWVTIYGGSPETYGALCGDANGFHRMLEGLEALSGVPTSLSVRVTFVKANRYEYAQMRDIAKRFSAKFAINPFVTKPVRGVTRDIEDIRLTAEEAYWLDEVHTESFREQAGSADPTSQKRTKNELIGEDRIALATEMGYTYMGIAPTVFQCSAVKTQYSVSWDGRMLPCLNFDTPCAFPLEIGMKAAWEQLFADGMKVPRCPECQSCEDVSYCMNCAGYLQTETGSFEKPAPYLCSLARARRKALEASGS